MSAELAYLPSPSEFNFNPNTTTSVIERKNPFTPAHTAVDGSCNNKQDVKFQNNGLEISSQLHGITTDLEKINELQRIFNKALGIENNVKLNYNPILARWAFEELTSPEKLSQFKRYELFQIETTLRERNDAAQSSVNYIIGDDGEIYNDLFPNKPFEHVLKRGIAYQQEQGTVEPDREQSEIDGWKEICNVLKDPNTPLNSKAVVMSGPGVAEGSMYKNNFVDIYEALEDPDTRKRFIKMTRNASGLNYDQYYDIAQRFQADFFTGLQGPIDAWFLKHPLYFNAAQDARTTDEIFEQIFGSREGAMKEEDFQRIWLKVKPFAQYFIDHDISAPIFDPKSLALNWNAVLNKNDNEKDQLNVQELSVEFQKGSAQFTSIADEMRTLGKQQVRAVEAACGMSAGFSVSSESGSATDSIFSNSVAKFGLEKDEKGALEFKCPACDFKNKRPYGKLIKLCQNAKCPDPTAVSCKNDKDKDSVTIK